MSALSVPSFGLSVQIVDGLLVSTLDAETASGPTASRLIERTGALGSNPTFGPTIDGIDPEVFRFSVDGGSGSSFDYLATNSVFGGPVAADGEQYALTTAIRLAADLTAGSTLRDGQVSTSLAFVVDQPADVNLVGQASVAGDAVSAETLLTVELIETSGGIPLSRVGIGGDGIEAGLRDPAQVRLNPGTQYEFVVFARLASDPVTAANDPLSLEATSDFTLTFTEVPGGSTDPEDPGDDGTPMNPVPIPTPATLPLGLAALAVVGGRRRSRD